MSYSTDAAPFLSAYHDLTTIYPPNMHDNCAVKQELLTLEQWDAFIERRQMGCTYICKTPELPGTGRLHARYKRRETWICDHSGSYRDRSVANLSPQKPRIGCATGHNGHTLVKGIKSKKVGCRARIVARWLQSSDMIEVDWHFRHTGHDPLSVESWVESSLPASVKSWIKRRVAEGRDWKSIHDLLRVPEEVLDMLDARSLHIPGALKVKRMDIYNELRKAMIANSRRSPDLEESIQLWLEEIYEKDGWTYSEDFEEDMRGIKVKGWMVCFASRWQKTLLETDAQNIVCLDATHNTCIGRTPDEKVQLYSIVVRNKKTGQGCPTAFMLTNDESALPIKKWLHAMKTQLSFQPEHFMIDCSDIEALAINWAYADKPPHILFCDWHLMKALVKKGKEILSASSDILPKQRTKISQELRKSAKDGFVQMMNSTTPVLFDEAWVSYKEEWTAFPRWIQYIQREWMPTKERWCRAWRQSPHEGIDTNNFIERWHGHLKSRYLGLIRRQRLDYLIHLLFDKVLPDYHQQEKAAELGITSARMCKAELESRKKAYQLSADEAASLIEESIDGYTVQSFSLPDKHYSIQMSMINGAQCIEKCSCPLYMLTCLACKHMWILVRNLGLSFAAVARLKPSQAASALAMRPKPETNPSDFSELTEVKQLLCKTLVNDAEQLVRLCQQLSSIDFNERTNISRDSLHLIGAQLKVHRTNVTNLLYARALSAKQLW